MQILSRSAADTLRLGKVISKNLQRGDIICLFGELGAGKTVLAQGIGQGLGLKRSAVISPSFVLVREYPCGKFPLYHLDLYRLKSAQDALSLGYEEYLYGDGIAVIEWPGRLEYLLPRESLRIRLRIQRGTRRSVELDAEGRHYQELLGKICKEIYLKRRFSQILPPIR